MSSEIIFGILILQLVVILLLLRLVLRYTSEFSQFVKSVNYRDFSRHYDPKGGLFLLTHLRKGFNLILDTFRTISREKEMQYQYLQTLLEMVDTGILAYENESGKVMWMNDALRNLLGTPYLKTIESLNKRDPAAFRQILELAPGQRVIIPVRRGKDVTRVVLSATKFVANDVNYKLIAFQNVNEAMDEVESMAWQKLLSVMTHEIMNSVAPISSLANTLKSRLKELPADAAGQVGDIELGIETIYKRSEGLLRFAEVYRNLYKLTAGRFKMVRLSEVFGNIHQLMKHKLEQLNITTEIIMKEPLLEVKIDQGLIEQVLINLILNAVDAVKDNPAPRIVMTAYTDNDNRPIIKIADNGTGIPSELMDMIFIPFFSTKKNGNGIGLPLCKQIMQLHKGTISLQSVTDQGTAVYLRF